MSRKAISTILTCLLCLLPALSFAQSLSRLEYWFDDAFSTRKTLNLNGSDETVVRSLNTDGLDNGLHKFNFRVFRSDGKYSAISTSLFFKQNDNVGEVLEYWIDDDYDRRVSVGLSGTADEQDLTFDLSDPELYPLGFHLLNFRVATGGKGMSAVYTTGILKIPSGKATQVEYWFDNDIEDSKLLDGHLSSDKTGYIINTDIDVSNLSVGLHRLNYRACDKENNYYGAVLTASIMKVPTGKAFQVEYWFDNDIAGSKILTGHLSSDKTGYIINTDIDVSHLSVGMHRLNYRACDKENNYYGAVLTASVMKVPSGIATQVEYWFDNDIADSKILTGHLSSDKTGYIINTDIDVSQLSVGMHRLNYRACDKENNFYGAVLTAPILKVPSGNTSILEYWLDGDMKTKKQITASGTSGEYLFSQDLDLGTVTPGHHRLSFRSRSSDGKRVTAVTSVPIIVKSRYNVDTAVTDAKMSYYSISVDGELPVELSFPHSGNVVDLNHRFDGRYLTSGSHQLDLRMVNNLGVAVSLQHGFIVSEHPATPVITLTAENRGGLINICFNSIPSDNGYRIYRVDANGAYTIIKNGKVSMYPADIHFTDDPPAGSYTYYAKSLYTDIDGKSQHVKSNEVSVSVAEPQKELGYIEGEIYYDGKRKVGFKSNIRFTDGVVVQSNEEGVFRRDKIPVGKELSVFLTENDYYTSNTATITVAKGKNNVRLNAYPNNDCTLNDQINFGNLTFYDNLIWEPGAYFKLPLINTSHETWNGKICIKAIPKRYVNEEENSIDSSDNNQESEGTQVLAGSIASISSNLPFFQIKNFQTFESKSFQLSYKENMEIVVPLTGFHNDGPTELYNFYVYCVKTNGSMSLVLPNNSYTSTQCNPMDYLIEGGTNEEYRKAFLTNLIVYFCTTVKEVDKMLGYASNVLGYNEDRLKNDFYKLTHATEEGVLADEGMQEVVYNMIKKCDEYSSEVKSFRDAIAPIVSSVNIWDDVKNDITAIKKFSEEISSKNDYEKAIYLSNKIISLSNGNFSPIMKTYLDITKKTIDNVMNYAWAYNQSYLPQDLYYKKFKIKINVIGKNGIPINFPFQCSGLIDHVLVKGWNKTINDKPAIAEARFKNVSGNLFDLYNAVFDQEGIDNGSNLFSDGDTPFKQLWAEIYWRNGRISVVPLTHGIDGVEYERAGNSSIFNITFDSDSKEYDHATDIIHLRDK